VKYSELVRRLRRLGIEKADEGARHEIWIRAERQLRTVIPRHQSREIPPGTLARILRDLGLTLDDLR
jgi:predicted RNA binding protein YcfA (HicA-like mRNA interferase family)